MAKSNKPIVWGLFAAGGTVTAFITPVLVLLTLFAAMRFSPGMFTYEHLHALAANWLGKLIIFGIVTLSLWHAAHRLRVTVHDFGVRSDLVVATIVYMIAAIGTVSTIFSLLSIH
ncbi:MAG TPA: fumarate reductase subunit D [Candidatus Competibacter sp.]|jgi:fumarate reductase subunit D|nr:fumarate reductase subunit D [Candidatus Competibacter sp.]MCC9002645.1 fumarate reductase subunit D [Candidatus Competibacter sp.]HRF63329.1 fumarate reductase subunit D [Candidatus Competibacter sp.]HRX59929.1 fumarate reductase subunit D [Candidatus Competibacter sp.]HUM89763.1 fumarate reductase subunit D [Candidatus Competibacter sp.]